MRASACSRRLPWSTPEETSGMGISLGRQRGELQVARGWLPSPHARAGGGGLWSYRCTRYTRVQGGTRAKIWATKSTKVEGGYDLYRPVFQSS